MAQNSKNNKIRESCFIVYKTQSSNENIGTIRALYGFYFYHKFSLIVLAGSNKETDIILYIQHNITGLY